ncbi:MAG TPA: long-chain fatty acid--CoA ligase [Smithella sp.]|nr:long-chain fatty acid--CoA ligase [Smithella sp.]HRS97314.1 long-chain fatty acid--CoA ligase [Smithella sp.]
MDYRMDTLCGLFHNQALRYGDRFVFLTGRFDADGRVSPAFSSRTWKQTRDEVIALARGLIALGIKKDDKVAVYSESRPRWIIADQAVQACRAVGVPLYPTVSEEELAYMLEDSESVLAIVSTPDKARRVFKVTTGKKRIPVVMMSPWEGDDPRPEGVYTFPEVFALGEARVSADVVEQGIRGVTPEDVASIIYTSGTTGQPKGVILTQSNWVHSMHQCSASEIMNLTARKDLHLKALVHLPLCHVYGRMSDYHAAGLKMGGELVFAESYQTLARDVREVRPNIINSIPRFYEKTYEIVQSVLSRAKKPYQALYNWAMGRGKIYVDCMATGRRMPPHQLMLFGLANSLVFDRLKKEMGMDRLVMACSGGGKLSKDICVFFRALGIQLMEGYGLTETTAINHLNAPEIMMEKPPTGILKFLYDKIMAVTLYLMVVRQSRGKSPYANPLMSLVLSVCYNTLIYRLRVKPGTVGRVVPQTEMRIAPDGEILIKGPQVFQGYWKRDKDTAEAFTPDGFFMTGDIGVIDEDGFLQITDRKKELFVTSGGKNIAPHPIEVALIERPYIDQACLIGDGRKYLTALIVPDFESLKRYAKNKSIAFSSPEELVKHPEIRELISGEVDKVNATLARYEQIKYFTILERPFDIATGELTPTLKVKRRVVNEKYRKQIEEMYNK